MRAIEAASDGLFRERGHENVSYETSRRAAAQRRADAVGLMAERAMAVGFGGSEANDTPISGTRAERYQVVLHVDSETLSAEASGLGRSEFEDGTRVSYETSRRLSCDAAVVPIRHGSGANQLDVGRRTRTIPPALRRALETRDRGCRFPGCGLRFTDAHHVQHWADGGETSLSNLVLLCSHHHRLVHEAGWTIEWWGEGRPAFLDPRGQAHCGRMPLPPALPLDPNQDPVDTLIEQTRSRGADPDFYTAGARWNTEFDIPRELYLKVLEAMG